MIRVGVVVASIGRKGHVSFWVGIGCDGSRERFVRDGFLAVKRVGVVFIVVLRLFLREFVDVDKADVISWREKVNE